MLVKHRGAATVILGILDAPLSRGMTVWFWRQGSARSQSSGSTRTIEAPWLLPTQKVGGVVELSTNMRRMLVSRGSGYSTASPRLGLRLTTRSVGVRRG